MPSHVSAMVPPRGVVAPSPVTTTRRSLMGPVAPCGMGTGVCSALQSPPPPPDCVGGRRRSRWIRVGSGLVLGDEADGVADGGEVLDLVVGDAHAELLLG